ncbi:unnamed protein product, partial [marine sediment metagenome]
MVGDILCLIKSLTGSSINLSRNLLWLLLLLFVCSVPLNFFAEMS